MSPPPPQELVRSAESHPVEKEDDHLARLTRDFLRELSSLDGDKPNTGDSSRASPVTSPTDGADRGPAT